MTKILNSKLIIILIISFVLFPVATFAAKLYLEPTQGEYYQGDTSIVNIRIDAEEECINTIKADISFSQDILEVVDFSSGDSILTFWIDSPIIEQEAGIISFIGGIPGGYCGRLPGDPGESNLLGKIIFKVKETGGEQFSANLEFLDTSQVLLNDGLGTPAKLSTGEAVFTILPKPFGAVQGRDEWQEELTEDKTPPEVFKIEISQDPSIFEGKYFITFYTADKQTGIDHYEVKEGGRAWQKTSGPYPLEDQDLRSIIKVKAVDKVGNERIAEYTPTKPFPYWIIIVVLILAVGGIIWRIKKKSKIKNEKF